MTTGTRVLGTPNTTPGFYYKKTWSGGDDPKAHRAFNTYIMSSVKQELAPTYVRWNSNGVVDAIQSFQTLGARPPMNTSILDNKAITKLAGQVRGHDFNAGVFGAEMHKTVSLIKGSASAILGTVIALKRGDLSGALRSVARIPGQLTYNRQFVNSQQGKYLAKRSITNKYIETPQNLRSALRRSFSQMGYGSSKIRSQQRFGTPVALSQQEIGSALLAIRYGWLPLMKDIEEFGKAVESMVAEKRPQLVTFRARATEAGSFDDEPYVNAPYDTTAVYLNTISYTLTVRDSNLSVPKSLGLLDPLSVAWELVPYSFVVDWFIPVGQYLQNVSTFDGLNYGYCRTVHTKSYCIASSTSYPPANMYPGRVILNRGYCIKLCLWMDRSFGATLPVHLYQTRLDKALSDTHLQNAAALIQGLVSRARLK